MTRTEERLTDALAARAAAVREDSLRPLIAGELGRPGTADAGRDRPRSWQARMAPLAAAAAMLLVISGTIFAVREFQGTTNASFADVASADAPPPYYVDLDWTHMPTVRATSTGLVTDRLRPPAPYQWGGTRLETALAAAPNGRTFVVIYDSSAPPYRLTIYTFALTSDGHIADFAPAKGGVLPGLARMSAAVSPDGSRVAIAGVPEAAANGNGQPLQPARIVVVNLRTGRRVVFQGGMDQPGQQFGINDVSWANDGKSLAYLAQWCPQLDVQFNDVCDGPQWPATQLRTISASSGSGPLSRGRILRGSWASHRILQALVSPDGRSVYALTMRGNEACLVRYAMRTGGGVAVLYCRPATKPLLATFLVSDGTGRYLIVDENFGGVDGWVHDGRFHSMKIGRVELWAAPAW